MLDTVATVTPAQKAAATRAARKAQAVASVRGFCEPAALAILPEEDLIAAFQQLGEAIKSRILPRRALNSLSLVKEYLQSAMAFEENEQFRVLFLDKRNNLIADEILQRGVVDHVPVYPRQVAARALALNATAMILAHNHPSGDPAPSTADITMTKQIVDVLQPLGITVHDHIIVGREGTASLRALGKM